MSILKDAKEAILKIKTENPNGTILVAIDGKSGSGKSTLAARLHEELGGNIFHMDDFFLRPQQRTEARLAEVGGNVDYERFGKILWEVRRGETVIYRAFNCKKQIIGNGIIIGPQKLNIIEGAYSMHPFFGRVYDLKIALDIEKEEQRRRILQRNGEKMLKRFEEEWIPKENAYLEKFKIYERSHLVFHTDKNEEGVSI
ncbi:uridine kinase [Kineothrix alysoides]|uniref:Uridine kinase n=1 Tax=Kineothrix alysoides TaxID=1469948 RepID=A0A4V2QCF4_9FIRM|nr:hypothetical protein [Kineothrix alysoides]TCL60067.1 uridine kinase [Kineothrix alysoides]